MGKPKPKPELWVFYFSQQHAEHYKQLEGIKHNTVVINGKRVDYTVCGDDTPQSREYYKPLFENFPDYKELGLADPNSIQTEGEWK